MAHLIGLNMAQIRIQFQIDNAAFDGTPVPETERILEEIIADIKTAWHNWDKKNKMTGFGGLVADKNGNGIGHWVAENIDERY